MLMVRHGRQCMTTTDEEKPALWFFSMPLHAVEELVAEMKQFACAMGACAKQELIKKCPFFGSVEHAFACCTRAGRRE
eukprot:358734-Chlamydomonas_euryale.AAC.1